MSHSTSISDAFRISACVVAVGSHEAHRRELTGYCYRMMGSSHDSDDMVQEAMLRAWNARGSLADPARVKPWLYRIATNACLDELRSRARRAMAPDLAAAAPGEVFPPAAPLEDAGPGVPEPGEVLRLPDGVRLRVAQPHPAGRAARGRRVARADARRLARRRA